MLPGGVTLALTAMVGGRLFDKIGFKPLLLTGLILLTFILSLFTTISSETTTMTAAVLYAAFTIGVGLSIGPVMTLALNQVPKPLHAQGSAISNTINQVSGAIGPALYTSIMTMASQHFIQQSNETNKKYDKRGPYRLLCSHRFRHRFVPARSYVKEKRSAA
ncbi:MFS transporter [Priestia megaterium]|uniref:MFS transporter n=1 Tax=Priestia megaterium TaxID=1404 RepID=UPI003EEB7774